MDIQDVFTYIFSVLILAIPLFAIYRCLLNRNLSGRQKVFWILIALIVPFFGGLIYLILFHKKP